MSTFSQWYKSAQKGNDPRQVYWLCGTESVLIEYIITVTKRMLEAKHEFFEHISIIYERDKDFWNEAYQGSFADGAKLIVLRGADKLKSPEKIEDFIKTRTQRKNTYLIFVSDEEAPPRVPKPDEEYGTELPSWLKCLTGVKGQVVECKPFTQSTASTAVEWVRGQVHLREGLAAHILNRAGGDLKLVRDVCVMLRTMQLDATPQTVNDIIDQVPVDGFVDALISGNKMEALDSLSALPPSEYPRLLALLDSRIDLLYLINEGLAARMSRGEISKKAGKQGFLVPQYVDYAKGYNAERVAKARDAILIFDRILASGAEDGVMEALVAEW